MKLRAAIGLATVLNPLLVGGCALRNTHHRARIIDPSALSVVGHPRHGEGARVLVPRGDAAASTVVLHEPDGAPLDLRVSGARDGAEAPVLRLGRGESLLADVPLLRDGVLDGVALLSRGLSGAELTWYRDPSGLLIGRYNYVPTPPSLRQAFTFEWQWISGLYEDEPPPLRVELVTPPENLQDLTRIDSVPWEVPAVLTTLGILMSAAGLAVLADVATRPQDPLSTGLGIGIGILSIGFGTLGLGVGLATFLAGEDVQPLDTGSLPALPR